MTGTYRVHCTPHAVEYGEVVATLIAADPVLTSVVATNLRREVDNPGTFSDVCWMWIEDSPGTPVGAAMHTPPWPPHVASQDPQVGSAIAAFLAKCGRSVTGVGGRRPAVEAFAQHWTAAHGCRASVRTEEGIYEATDVVLPSGVAGSMRRARPEDTQLLNTWARGFISETSVKAPDRDDLLGDRIRAGHMWIWRDETNPVSMAYASPHEGGVSRISWVYTPPAHRRRGYASALVAGMTAAQLHAGVRCMLYTDLSNPTSNGVYQSIGYRRVGDGLRVSFDPTNPETGRHVRARTTRRA